MENIIVIGLIALLLWLWWTGMEHLDGAEKLSISLLIGLVIVSLVAFLFDCYAWQL